MFLLIIILVDSPEEKEPKINTLFSNFLGINTTKDTNKLMNNRYQAADLESGIQDNSIRLSMSDSDVNVSFYKLIRIV